MHALFLVTGVRCASQRSCRKGKGVFAQDCMGPRSLQDFTSQLQLNFMGTPA